VPRVSLTRQLKHQSSNYLSVLYQHCDVTSWTEQRDLFDAAIAKHGKIDIVCANAGILPKEDTFDWTYDSNGKLEAPVKVAKILDVNLLGHIYSKCFTKRCG
jgi:NAD(P)-dependent dehydrogenase (short-subunit alcohol dehydrogenase family)